MADDDQVADQDPTPLPPIDLPPEAVPLAVANPESLPPPAPTLTAVQPPPPPPPPPPVVPPVQDSRQIEDLVKRKMEEQQRLNEANAKTAELQRRLDSAEAAQKATVQQQTQPKTKKSILRKASKWIILTAVILLPILVGMLAVATLSYLRDGDKKTVEVVATAAPKPESATLQKQVQDSRQIADMKKQLSEMQHQNAELKKASADPKKTVELIAPPPAQVTPAPESAAMILKGLGKQDSFSADNVRSGGAADIHEAAKLLKQITDANAKDASRTQPPAQTVSSEARLAKIAQAERLEQLAEKAQLRATEFMARFGPNNSWTRGYQEDAERLAKAAADARAKVDR